MNKLKQSNPIVKQSKRTQTASLCKCKPLSRKSDFEGLSVQKLEEWGLRSLLESSLAAHKVGLTKETAINLVLQHCSDSSMQERLLIITRTECVIADSTLNLLEVHGLP